MASKILIALDDSEISMAAVSYVARLIADPNGFEVRLFHVLPPVPPELLEHGGAEDPDELSVRERELAGERARWIDEARKEAQPIFTRARAILENAGLRSESIQDSYRTSVHREDVAREILDAAKDAGCDTVVVGKHSFPWYKGMVRKHVAEELLDHGENVAVTVVL